MLRFYNFSRSFDVIRFYKDQESYKNLNFCSGETAIFDFGQSTIMKIRNRFYNQAEIRVFKVFLENQITLRNSEKIEHFAENAGNFI